MEKKLLEIKNEICEKIFNDGNFDIKNKYPIAISIILW